MLINGEEKDCCDFTDTIIRHENNGKNCKFSALPMEPEWAHIHARDCPGIEIKCSCGEDDINSFFVNVDDITCMESDTDLVSEDGIEPSLINIQPLAEDGYPWPRMKINDNSWIRVNGPDLISFCKGNRTRKLVKRISTFINYLRNDDRDIQIVFPELSEDSLNQIEKFCSSIFLGRLDIQLQDNQIELELVIGSSNEPINEPINSQDDAFEFIKNLRYEFRNSSTI